MNPVAISVAFIAGALATVNPCGFALLPAFLSIYLGNPRPARTRARGILHGTGVGALVATGFMGVFMAIGIPVALGATALTKAFPVAGLAVGFTLVALGLLQLLRGTLAFSIHSPIRPGSASLPRNMVIFGAGYGIASLGCTLPVFLAVLGGSLASGGTVGALLVLISFGAGMATVLVGVTISLGLVQRELVTRLRRVSARVGRLGGALLLVVGGYLVYYWANVINSPLRALDDPLIAFGAQVSSSSQAAFASGPGRGLAGAAFALWVIITLWAWFAARQADRRSTPRGS